MTPLVDQDCITHHICACQQARLEWLEKTNKELLAACEAFITAQWEKSLQLEKTDIALRMAKDATSKAKGDQ